jgi:polyhydroxyalkanoate synthesis regulator phasin
MQIHFSPPVGLAEAMVPDFLRRDVRIMNEHFALDDAQQAIVDALYGDYERQFNEGARGVRESLDQLRPTVEQQEELRRFNHNAIQRRLGELVDEIRELQQLDSRDAEARADELKEHVRQLKDTMRQGDGAAMDVDLVRRLMADFDAVVSRWSVTSRSLHGQFLNDVRALLSDEQQQLWPAFERKMRRVKTLPRGTLSGESTDLLSLINELDLVPNQRPMLDIAAMVHEFELALDERLRERNTYLEHNRDARAAVLHNGDQTAAAPLIDAEAAHRVAVRDTNVRYARSIAQTLDGELGGELLLSFGRQSYPKAYRPTRAQRSFDAIVQLPDLEPALRASIENLRGEYDLQLDAGRSELIALIHTYEPVQLRVRFLAQVARASDRPLAVPDDNPLFDAFAAQRDAEQRWIERALSVLSEQQVRTLPGFVRAGTRWSDEAIIEGQPVAAPQTPQQRKDFAAQFDANGDGRLDDEERERLREAMKALYMKEASEQ